MKPDIKAQGLPRARKKGKKRHGEEPTTMSAPRHDASPAKKVIHHAAL
jgi:hypothetical protein